MNAAGECRPPERRSALSHRADGAFVHAGRRYGPSFLAVLCRCAPKHQAGGGLAVGAGRRRFFCRGTVLRFCPCGRNGDAAAGIVCGIPGVFPLLQVHAPLFFGGGSTLRGAFRTGAFAVRLQRSFCSGKPGAFIRRLLPGKGHPRRSLFFRHTCLAACGNRWAFMKASRGFNPESPRPFPGGGFLSAHGRYGTCCGVMPSRRFRDFPRPCAVLLRQEREEGEYLHRFSGARRAAGRIFLCLPRQRPR